MTILLRTPIRFINKAGFKAGGLTELLILVSRSDLGASAG